MNNSAPPAFSATRSKTNGSWPPSRDRASAGTSTALALSSVAGSRRAIKAPERDAKGSAPGRQLITTHAAERRSSGIRPADTSEDFPLPDGPEIWRSLFCASLLTRDATTRSRPKKYLASPSVKADRPRYGEAESDIETGREMVVSAGATTNIDR